MDVNITEEEQDILTPPPSPGAHLQAPPARKLLIQLDQSEAPEPSLSGGQKNKKKGCFNLKSIKNNQPADIKYHQTDAVLHSTVFYSQKTKV